MYGYNDCNSLEEVSVLVIDDTSGSVFNLGNVELPSSIVIYYEQVIPAHIDLLQGNGVYPVVAETCVFETRLTEKRYDKPTGRYIIRNMGYRISNVDVCLYAEVVKSINRNGITN